MTDVLRIGNTDFSDNIEAKKMVWRRRSVETKGTVYVKSGFARRYKTNSKVDISYVLSGLTRQQLAVLDDYLNRTFFDATYLDLQGEQTRTFFSEDYTCVLETAHTDDGEWGEATFTMKER